MKKSIKVVKYDTESESESSESSNSDVTMEDEIDSDDIDVDDNWSPYKDDLQIPKPQRKASRKANNVNSESHFDKKINYLDEENHAVKITMIMMAIKTMIKKMTIMMITMMTT